jgi:hypothetical protein
MFNYIVIILLIIILLNKVNNNKFNMKQIKKKIKKNNIIEILPDKSITIQNKNIINNIINRKLVN